MIIAADANTLFPSINQEHSAEIVRREIMLSKISVSGTDWKNMARYLRMTCPPRLWSRWKIRNFLPKRAKTGGTEPTILGPEARFCNKDSEQWTYPSLSPSDYEKKVL